MPSGTIRERCFDADDGEKRWDEPLKGAAGRERRGFANEPWMFDPQRTRG